MFDSVRMYHVDSFVSVRVLHIFPRVGSSSVRIPCDSHLYLIACMLQGLKFEVERPYHSISLKTMSVSQSSALRGLYVSLNFTAS